MTGERFVSFGRVENRGWQASLFRVEHATRMLFAATRREYRETVAASRRSFSKARFSSPVRRVAEQRTRVACSTHCSLAPRQLDFRFN